MVNHHVSPPFGRYFWELFPTTKEAHLGYINGTHFGRIKVDAKMYGAI